MVLDDTTRDFLLKLIDEDQNHDLTSFGRLVFGIYLIMAGLDFLNSIEEVEKYVPKCGKPLCDKPD